MIRKMFFCSFALLTLAACGQVDTPQTPRDISDVSYVDTYDAGQDSSDTHLTDANQPDINEQEDGGEMSGYCLKKLQEFCRKYKDLAGQGVVDDDLYEYVCLGPGRKHFVCFPESER